MKAYTRFVTDRMKSEWVQLGSPVATPTPNNVEVNFRSLWGTREKSVESALHMSREEAFNLAISLLRASRGE